MEKTKRFIIAHKDSFNYSLFRIKFYLIKEYQRMKEKIIEKLGFFGLALWYLWGIIVSALPAAVITTKWLWRIVIFTVQFFIPSTSGVFWIWGLIKTIFGKQDALAIIYYICTVVLFLPFFISSVASLISSIKGEK